MEAAQLATGSRASPTQPIRTFLKMERDPGPEAACEATEECGCAGNSVRDGWDELPPELALRVFARIVSDGFAPASRLVCRSWASGAAEACGTIKARHRSEAPKGWGRLFGNVTYLYWPFRANFSRDTMPLGGEELRALGRLQTLYLECPRPGSIGALAAAPPTLTTLRMTYCQDLLDADLAVLRPLSGTLQTLILDYAISMRDPATEHIQHMTSLTRLDLLHATELTNRGVGRLGQLTRLRQLSLRGARGCTDEGMGFVKNLPDLESICLYSCFGITSLDFLSGATGLAHLDLGFCEELTPSSLTMLQNLPSLSTLNVSRIPAVSGRLLGLLKRSTNLTDLNLAECMRVGDEGLKHLREMPQLRSLNLHSLHHIHDEGLRNLEHHHSLTRLELSTCMSLTNSGLLSLRQMTDLQHLGLNLIRGLSHEGLRNIQHIKSLKSLNLGGCLGITDADLPIIGGFTNLRKLDIDCNRLTDEGLTSLRGLTDLEKLTLPMKPEIMPLHRCIYGNSDEDEEDFPIHYPAVDELQKYLQKCKVESGYR